MKQILTSLGKRLPLSLMIPCAIVPLPLALMAKHAPSMLHLAWIWTATFALMDCWNNIIRGKWRILYGLSQVGIFTGLALWMFSSLRNTPLFLVPMIYSIAALAELPRNIDKRAFQVRLVTYGIVGVASHLIIQVFLYTSTLADNPILEPVAPWLLIAFFLFVFSGVTMLNRANLSLISQGRLFAGTVMKRKNLLLTLAFLAIALAVACIPGVIAAVSKLFQWLFVTLLFLFTLMGNLGKAPPDSSMPSVEPGENAFGEATPEGVRPEWLEILIAVVSLLVVVVAVILAVYILSRKLMQLIRYLDKRLRSYLNSVTEDYIDEVTDTRDDPDRVQRKAQKQRPLSPLEVGKLSPNQRIRYRYRQLMRQNPQWSKGSTPRENLSDEAASVYEAVRYGEETANDNDARRFTEETKRR